MTMNAQMGTYLNIAGIIGGALVVLIPVVKWFLNDWAKKSAALEKMKTQRVDRIEEEGKEIRSSIRGLQSTLRNLSREMHENKAEMQLLGQKIDSSIQHIDNAVTEAKSTIKEEVRAQVEKATEQNGET